jgi:uncharacterized membrane protein
MALDLKYDPYYNIISNEGLKFDIRDLNIQNHELREENYRLSSRIKDLTFLLQEKQNQLANYKNMFTPEFIKSHPELLEFL